MLKKLPLLIGILSIFIAISIYIQNYGWLLYGEADWFLIDHNTSERTYWNKILAPHKHDADQYLARETSHMIEHIDATFIHKCVMAGYPHFLSLSNYIFICLIVGLFWWAAFKKGINYWYILVLSCIFLTSPSILMSGTYMRPGHLHSAFWTVLLILWVYFYKNLKWGYLVTFFLSLMAVWADRQGLFACAVIWITIVALSIDKWKAHSLSILSAALFHTYYYKYIGPSLIAKYTDFQVGHNYQIDVVLTLFKTISENLVGGFTVTLNNISVLFGNVPYVFALSLVVITGLILKRRWWLAAFWFVMYIIMYALIMFHQKAMVYPDIIDHIYYNMFGTVVLFFIVGYLLKNITLNRWLVSLGCVIILSNVFATKGYINKWRSGHLGGFISGAPYVLAELKKTVDQPQGSNTNKFNTKESSFYTEFKHVMKNPIERRISVEEFVESSHYLQFVRSEKGLSFKKGGRE